MGVNWIFLLLIPHIWTNLFLKPSDLIVEAKTFLTLINDIWASIN